MKKHLLLGISIGFSVLAFGQNTSTLPNGLTPPKINPMAAKLSLPYDKNHQLIGDSFEAMVNNLQPNLHENHAKAFTSTNIGTTQYQLQTNSSICNRIVLNHDGTISATWTMAQDPAWADRGTGYNYYDGTAWGPLPTVRIENARTGFTNIGVTNTNAEIIVCHEAPAGGGFGNIHVDARPAKGTGAWTESALGFSDVWARMSVGGANGHTIHEISSSGNGTGTALISFHGQTGAITYSRSLDGGITWDKLRTIIPCLDSSHYFGFGGDAYAIDAKGDTIVIAAGGFDVDVVIAKSVDNGNTWTSTVVKQFPIPMYDGTTMNTDITGDGVEDTLETNDASVEVLLDNNGMAHVWYGRMRVIEAVGGTALNYFPGTQGLMYWNENMGANAPVMITSVLDLNFTGHPFDGLLNMDFDNVGNLLGCGTYQVSLTSFPTAGIDASGKIYLAYSGIFEGINDAGTVVPGAGSALPGKSFRHTYVMRSDDGGANWCPPIDITDPDIESGTYDYIEGVFGAMAKDVDGYVHVIVQDDNSVGHGVTASTPDPQTGPATIDYYKIPVNDLACGVGVNDKPALVNAINLYPNPAANTVNLKFNINKNSNAVVEIYNVMGQQVAHFDNQSIANGTVLTINLAAYKSGIYSINTLVEGKMYSQKLIVQ